MGNRCPDASPAEYGYLSRYIGVSAAPVSDPVLGRQDYALRPTITIILIYYKNYVAFLSPLQHQELVLTLEEEARKKILAKTQALRRSLAHQFYNPRPP